jgi:acetyl-CoA C-acetyltransferase
MKICIAATAQTKFGKRNEGIGDLMARCYQDLLCDASLDIGDIDASYISNFSSHFSQQCHLSALLSSKLHSRHASTRVEAACASGGTALRQASIAIASGLYNVVAVVGVEKMTTRSTDETTSILSYAGSEVERRHGITFPGLFALMARRHFHDYGTSEVDLAKIAVKNHKNALSNPNAHFHRSIADEDVLSSRIIASPLKVLDCAPISDGAAAVLVCNENAARRLTDIPVYLTGIAQETDYLGIDEREALTAMPAVVNAATKAFNTSGLTPSAVDVAELHDCFTIAELMEMEDLGFCAKGAGKELLAEGATNLDGEIPVNPSGGLKARGHPVGATGVAQVAEIVKQLRGEADKRQVTDAEIGLCCNVGGSGGTAVVSIFSR